MSVDKFGRHSTGVMMEKKAENLRGPPGIGYHEAPDGNYDIRGKRLMNLSNAVNSSDASTKEDVIMAFNSTVYKLDALERKLSTYIEKWQELTAKKVFEVHDRMAAVEKKSNWLETKYVNLQKSLESVQLSSVGEVVTIGDASSKTKH